MKLLIIAILISGCTKNKLEEFITSPENIIIVPHPEFEDEIAVQYLDDWYFCIR